MAMYRPVYVKIWDDPDFVSYTPQEKLLFVFLCTNKSTTESGVYPMPLVRIAQYTGMSQGSVKKIIESGRIKNISYDFDNQVVFIHNFLRYNGYGRPDLVKTSIRKDMKYIYTSLWGEFDRIYGEQYSDLLKEIEYPSESHLEPVQTDPPQSATDDSLGKPQSKEENQEIPVDKMFDIFRAAYKKINEMPCAINEKKSRPLAAELYRLCLEEDSNDPLGLFQRKAEFLIEFFHVTFFGGIKAYWNAAVN